MGVTGPKWCTCGHLMTVHDIGVRAGTKVRTACTAADPAKCGCRKYEERTTDGP